MAYSKTIIFRATDQWFASIDALKDMLEAIKTVDWIPAWGETRIANMIKDRKEWCISRQEFGVLPIPVFYNEDGTEILDKDIILHVADVFEKHGSDAWWTMDKRFITSGLYKSTFTKWQVHKKKLISWMYGLIVVHLITLLLFKRI